MGELAVVLQSAEPRRLRHPAGAGPERHALRGQRAGRLAEARADLAAQKATLVAKREQVAGDEARAGGARRSRSRACRREAIEAQQAVQPLIDEREQALAAVEREKAAEEARYAADAGRVAAPVPDPGRARPAGPARRGRAARAAGRSAAVRQRGARPGRCRPASPRRTACGCTRSPASTSCTTAPTSASAAARRCTPPRPAPSSRRADVTGYGNQLVIDHGVMRGVGLATSYNHLMQLRARAGLARQPRARSSATAAAARGCTAPATPPGATCTSWSTSTAARPTRWAGSRPLRSGGRAGARS